MSSSLYLISLYTNCILLPLCLFLVFKLYKVKLRPERLIDAFTKRFKIFWKKISSRFIKSPGRPPISDEIKAIIKKMYFENINIGGLRIYMNLVHLGYDVSLSSVYRELRKIKIDYPRKPTQKWKTFLNNSKVIAMDFLTVPIEITKDVFQEMFIFIMIDHEHSKVTHYNCTPNPSQEWVIQQFRNCFDQPQNYKYMIHDRDAIFMNKVKEVLPAFGLVSSPTAPRSPWQNPYVESFNATLRRELLNHVIAKDEFHLRRLLKDYVHFYNNYRMHSRLMNSPKAMQHYEKPPQKNALKKLKSIPVLNGLHHVYYWKDLPVQATTIFQHKKPPLFSKRLLCLNELTFRELACSSGFMKTVFFTLNHTRITGKQAVFF